jgi:hypothetical protein
VAHFFSEFAPDFDENRDIVIIHDPQPCAAIKYIKERFPRAMCIWRCHVGLDVDTRATKAAWDFLEPYLMEYDKCVFSAKEYVRPCVADKSVIIPPGISPLTPKNMELSPYDVSQILMRAGLLSQMEHLLGIRGCELVEPPFEATAVIYEPNTATCAVDASETPRSVETPMAATHVPSASDEWHNWGDALLKGTHAQYQVKPGVGSRLWSVETHLPSARM